MLNKPAAFSVTLPEPCAVTTLFTSSAPAVVRTSMLPLPAIVLTPVPPMIRPLVSNTTMSPLVLLVATSVPRVLLMSAPAPDPPMPVAATSVPVPLVLRLAVSAAVLSLIDPAVAVTLIALEVVVI